MRFALALIFAAPLLAQHVGGGPPSTIADAVEGTRYLNGVANMQEWICATLSGCASGAPTWSIHENPVTIGAHMIGGCPIFPDNNVWNTRIDGAPVVLDQNSATYTANATSSPLHPNIGYPMNLVGNSTPLSAVNFAYDGNGTSPQVTGGIPLAPSMNIEGYNFGNPTTIAQGCSGDCHVFVINTQTCRLYEVYDMSSTGSPYAAAGSYSWDLTRNEMPIDIPGAPQDAWTAANAAGTPAVAGMLTHAELFSGKPIKHALEFTLNHSSAAYVWPARHYAGHSTGWPPMGSRWRLKASFDTATCQEGAFAGQAYPAYMSALMTALKQYGMILVDNGGNMFLQADNDQAWGDPGSPTSDIWGFTGWARCATGKDFEVINGDSIMVDYNSAAAVTVK